jgi:hypothetical protein
VIGVTSDQNAVAIAIIGDSIADGTDDSPPERGYIQRAVEPYFAYVKMAMGGESAAGFIGTTAGSRRDFCSYSTDAIYEYGVNDLVSSTLAQLQASALAGWLGIPTVRQNIWACMLTPRTTSTDLFATTVNQTFTTNAGPAQTRGLYNAWLLDGAPMDDTFAPWRVLPTGTVTAVRAGSRGHPLTGVFNVAPYSATSDKWVVTGAANYATDDGTHPSTVIPTAMAAAIPSSSFTG